MLPTWVSTDFDSDVSINVQPTYPQLYPRHPKPCALLQRRGGRGPSGMNHIGQVANVYAEWVSVVQKCTTLTHSAYTFVIIFEHT